MHAICTNNVKEVNIMINCYKINLKQEKYYYNHFGHISEDELFIRKKKKRKTKYCKYINGIESI